MAACRRASNLAAAAWGGRSRGPRRGFFLRRSRSLPSARRLREQPGRCAPPCSPLPLAVPVLRNGLMGRPWGAPGERAGGSLLPGGAPGPRRGSREGVPRSARVKRGSETSGEGGSAAELPVSAWLGGPASRGGTGAAVGSEGSQSLLGAEGRSGGRPGRSCRGRWERESREWPPGSRPERPAGRGAPLTTVEEPGEGSCVPAAH